MSVRRRTIGFISGKSPSDRRATARRTAARRRQVLHDLHRARADAVGAWPVETTHDMCVVCTHEKMYMYQHAQGASLGLQALVMRGMPYGTIGCVRAVAWSSLQPHPRAICPPCQVTVRSGVARALRGLAPALAPAKRAAEPTGGVYHVLSACGPP